MIHLLIKFKVRRLFCLYCNFFKLNCLNYIISLTLIRTIYFRSILQFIIILLKLISKLDHIKITIKIDNIIISLINISIIDIKTKTIKIKISISILWLIITKIFEFSSQRNYFFQTLLFLFSQYLTLRYLIFKLQV